MANVRPVAEYDYSQDFDAYQIAIQSKQKNSALNSEIDMKGQLLDDLLDQSESNWWICKRIQ